MSTADVLPLDPLASILNDADAAKRRQRQQCRCDLADRRREQAEALDDAFANRYPEMYSRELGRKLTHDEHFAAWATALKRWGDAARACGCRVRNALRDWQMPPGPDGGQLREANFALYIARRAADPLCSAADLESDLRRTCMADNAGLLATLYAGGWLLRIHNRLMEVWAKRRPRPAGRAARQASATPEPIPPDILDIIARDRAATAAASEARERAAKEAEPLDRVRLAAERLRSYPGPLNADGNHDADWVALLSELRSALDGAGLLHLLDQLPPHDDEPSKRDARRLALHLLRMAGGDNGRRAAVEALRQIQPKGELDRALSRELGEGLAADLLRLLPGGDTPVPANTRVLASPVAASESDPIAAAPAAPNGRTGGAAATHRVSVNARMLETIQVNHEALGWSCKRWSEHLKCAKSTVAETRAWRDFGMARERERAERQQQRRDREQEGRQDDRRRRPKASDLRRADERDD